jgi:hypothetical protein
MRQRRDPWRAARFTPAPRDDIARRPQGNGGNVHRRIGARRSVDDLDRARRLMALTLRERASKRLKGLKAARLPYEAEWKEIAQHAQPSRSKFLYGDTDRSSAAPTGRSTTATASSPSARSRRE